MDRLMAATERAFTIPSTEIDGRCAASVSHCSDEWTCVVDVAAGTLGLSAPTLWPGTMIRGTVTYVAAGEGEAIGQTHALRTLSGEVPPTDAILAVVEALLPLVNSIREQYRSKESVPVAASPRLAPVLSFPRRPR